MSLSESAKRRTRSIASTQKYLTQDEMFRILSVLSSPEDVLLARVGIDLGARVGEVVNLPWTNVDFRERIIHIWDEKKDLPRDCTMSEPTWKLLENYANSIDKRVQRVVFPFSAKTANRRVKEWAKAAGIERRVRWHTWRHTFVVQSRRAGRDWDFIAQQTGDRVATLIEEYSKLSIEDRIRVTNEHPIIPGGIP